MIPTSPSPNLARRGLWVSVIGCKFGAKHTERHDWSDVAEDSRGHGHISQSGTSSLWVIFCRCGGQIGGKDKWIGWDR